MVERVSGDGTPLLSPEEQHCVSSVLEGSSRWAATRSTTRMASRRAACDRNVPPYVPGIRRALQEAAEAEIDPATLYQRAVAMYERLDARRRREHPEWGTWPAPPFEAVEQATWPPLKLEIQYSMHASRVISALWARDDEPQRVERLRRILRRAQGCGLDPATVYRKATEVHGAGGVEVDRRPHPPYAQVRPDRDAPQS